MKKYARAGMVTAAAFAAVVTSTSAASAAPSGSSDVARLANPAQACAVIPAALGQFGIIPEGFRYSSCVREVAGRVPDLEGAGSPYEQCAALEAGIETPEGALQISYPYVFYPSSQDPFPALKVNNREQCARALYAYHTIESYLPAGPPPQN